MRFHVVAPSVHLQRKCNGVCRRLLRAGTWVYGCDACQLDLCAACSPEGVIPAAAPHPPRVKAARPRAQHVRAQDPPPKRRAGSGSARRGGRHAPYEAVPCLTRTATMRPSTLGRTILWRDAALIRVRREMRWRRGEDKGKTETLRCPMHGRAVHRASPTGRGPGANAAAFPLYIRAGKVREREMGPLLGRLLHHLVAPAPPLLCLFDLVSVFLCGVFVSVCVCAAHCALHVVSPRVLWLCVLPGWQINMNVNVIPGARNSAG